ncbi:MAG: hypothetical protein AAGK97_18080, partial [Bacteroidota bacterium]
DSLIVPDLNSKNITFTVSGAANNDLANPNQGICGIDIVFKHEVVGDLTLELISPSGQSIFLTGPTGFSTLTDNSTWDISIIPCSQTASPDIGFLPVWSNGANWQSDINYTGSYYPNGGCLEDINSGSVNGNWTIHVSDNSQFDVGVILDFTIDFCDPSGINCASCEPDGGQISLAPIAACQGSDDLIIPFDPVFLNGRPNDAIYNYDFFIAEGGLIVDFISNPDLRSFEEGTYFLCGISYIASDQSKLPTVNDSLTIGSFRELINSREPLLCASTSNNCVRVDIFDTPEPIDTSIIVCGGDSVEFGGQVFNTTGIFNIPLQTDFGCDSLINLNLTVINPQAIVQPPAVL